MATAGQRLPVIAPPVSDKDRAEAASVTTQGDGHQFEIQLGHLCNNRCNFCSSGELTRLKLARRIPLEPILEAIEKARSRGARRITFLGGEPTLHKGFVQALEHTVKLGFDEIVIFTNGVMLPHPGFIDRIVALGKRFEWRISIQGGNEDAHVAVTGREDSFRRIIEGLRRLAQLGQDVTCNLCVNEHSYRSLPDFPALVKEHGVRQLHLDVIRPQSIGPREDDYLRSIMPRYSDMAPYFREMLEGFDRLLPEFDVNVGNMPYCILPEWADRVHHGGEKTITASTDAVGLEEPKNKYEWHVSLREHPPQCASCVFRPRCTGVFREYLAIHGADEFQPVTRDHLERVDEHNRSFTLRVEPAIEPIISGSPPEGWTHAGTESEPRDRRVAVQLSHSGGVRVRLVFTPPTRGDEARAILETARYRLALELDGDALQSIGAPAIQSVLSWVAERLGGATLDVHRLLGEVRSARAFARARARRDRLVEAISGASLGTWNVLGVREGGSVIEIGEPEGGRVDVLLDIVRANGRSRVGVDFRVIGDTSEEHAWPAIEAILTTVKGEQCARA